MRIKKHLLPLITLLGWVTVAKSQPVDSTLQEYTNKFPQERIYVHFDKSAYFPGDTVWYKAYLITGWSMSGISKTLYTDWIDASGKLMLHSVEPVMYASSAGQMLIPKDYKQGLFHLHAYTGWMLNFDSSFLFDKDIPVIQPPGAVPYKVPAHKVRVALLPEGGNMVQSLMSAVAFKAENQSGRPVAVNGVLRNKNGDVLDSIFTVHDGMGKFFLSPEAGESYSVAWWDNEGDSGSVPLAKALPAGALLKVSASAGKVSFHVDRSADAPANFKTMYLVGTMQQAEAFKITLDLGKVAGATNAIPANKLATGILQITLFDASWKPVAERIVFVNNNDYSFAANITATKKNLSKRGRNEIEINIPDTLASSMSVAVTDGDLAYDGNYNIISHLLLTSDLKGYVNNPGYYFSSNADSVKNALDLVMLTNGWRRYNWDDVIAGKLPVIKHPQETEYVTINGIATMPGNNAVSEGTLIFLNLEGKDPADSLHLAYSTRVKDDGSFSITPGAFYDSLNIRYRLIGKAKTSDKGIVTFNSSFLPPLQGYNYLHIGATTLQDSLALVNELAVRARAEELAKLLGQLTLKNVTVTAKAKTGVKALDEKYATSTFKNSNTGNTYSFDIAHDPDAKGVYSLGTYLMDKIPGLQVQMNGSPPVSAYYFRSHASISSGMTGKVQVYLDELATDDETASSIQLNDVAYVKFYKSGALVNAENSPALAIYTRQGDEGGGTSPLKGVVMPGFTPAKEFYNPDYSSQPAALGADVRTTLYWNPNIFTGGGQHKVKFVFYNNDISRKLRIVLEGMDVSGKLTRVEKFLE